MLPSSHVRNGSVLTGVQVIGANGSPGSKELLPPTLGSPEPLLSR